MNYCTIKNNERINLLDIPTIDFNALLAQLEASCLRPLSFFGCDWGKNIKIFAVLGDDEKGEILVSSALIDKNTSEFPSITPNNPQYHMFERELFEQFNLKPVNHPWLKPVRKNLNKYEFFKMTGEELHEVAVGPIHAGIIEPGHFRFMCEGEKVYNLEIMLGYQHRGVEDLMVKNPSNVLAESICGDSPVAYSMAYSKLIETLSNTNITPKAEIIRRIALEAERIAIHIGDMGAILGDIAYLMGKEVFGVTRTLVINTMLEITGSRFSRSLITTGGVNFDIDNAMAKRMVNVLDKVQATVEKMTATALKSSTVMSRLEKTGTVSTEFAKSINLVGMIARSMGLKNDVRYDYKDEYYFDLKRLDFNATNDALSRFKIRYKEVIESISFVKGLLKKLENHSNEELIVKVNPLIPNSFAVSIVESWRGELVHTASTNEQGNLSRYKIKDPSFNNWYGLALAVRNNGISDFPLCNKGFDLSYSGFDL